MKQTILRRSLSLFLSLLLLCALATLPVAAEGLNAAVTEKALSVWDAVSSAFAVRGLADVVAMFEGAQLAFLLIFTVVALLFALWGYNLSRALFIGSGFAAGWMLGSLIYDPIVSVGLLGENPHFLIRYGVYLALGVVVICLAKRILRTGVFAAAALSTYLFLSGFAIFEILVDSIVNTPFEYKYLIGRLLVAAAVGALALSITKPVMIIVTALAGGTLGAVALCVVLGIGHMTAVITAMSLIFAGAGILSQFRLWPRRKTKKKAVHRKEDRFEEEEAEQACEAPEDAACEEQENEVVTQ